jgi:NAD(P)-dependent dehydrogenase (short-subunit alcohol dehydrogenase family)
VPRIWLITGANSGFGRAITEAAVAAGDTVVATARNVENLNELISAHPGRVDTLSLDVTNPGAAAAVAADVAGRYGQIDVLVNNAGRSHVGALEETTDAELRAMFDVGVFGPAALIRAVLPRMRARGSGTIVQISSMGGQMSFAGFSAYSATKFALEGMSEALADEVRPLGIRVLIVEPGAFRTSLWASGTMSTPIAAYDGTVGPTRQMVQTQDGAQVGDPAKAAAAILAALDSDDPPLRLALGGDAVDAITEHLDQVRADITAWEAAARDTRHAG